MIYSLLIFLSIVFFEMFVLLRMSKEARAILRFSQESMRVVLSSEDSDSEREAFIRRASYEIFKATWRFAVKLLFIGFVLYMLFQVAVIQFPDFRKPMFEALTSPVFIAILTAATVCYALVRKAILARL